MEKFTSDPEQKLMIAVWMMALHDINQGFLLKQKLFQFDEKSTKGQEVIENFWDAYAWIYDGSGTFALVAALFSIPEEDLRRKTLKIIKDSSEKIQERSKTTNQYIYATVSRFRNYDKSFEENILHA